MLEEQIEEYSFLEFTGNHAKIGYQAAKEVFGSLVSRRFVPKAPYHSPVRCRIVRRLDGELIRARGSQNHREISCNTKCG